MKARWAVRRERERGGVVVVVVFLLDGVPAATTDLR